MKEAQKLQAQLLEQLRAIRVEGSAGGGMVKIEMDGEQNVHAVKIEPQLLEERDIGMLEDLVVAAFSDARRKVLEKSRESLRSLAGFPLPPF
ncbi:YbaB/EbfC family nucleoid-associated protein [candidate division WOR-3 bacterium]|nr:YbaB/EbfC family nucleoid-associated protein [candidate division WOR-3 bacterium]